MENVAPYRNGNLLVFKAIYFEIIEKIVSFENNREYEVLFVILAGLKKMYCLTILRHFEK